MLHELLGPMQRLKDKGPEEFMFLWIHLQVVCREKDMASRYPEKLLFSQKFWLELGLPLKGKKSVGPVRF